MDHPVVDILFPFLAVAAHNFMKSGSRDGLAAKGLYCTDLGLIDMFLCRNSENCTTSQIWKVPANMVFPPIWGEKMAAFRAWACKLSWTLFSLAQVQPLYGAGRKESSVTGLDD